MTSEKDDAERGAGAVTVDAVVMAFRDVPERTWFTVGAYRHVHLYKGPDGLMCDDKLRLMIPLKDDVDCVIQP